jgi:hypothetical protein
LSQSRLDARQPRLLIAYALACLGLLEPQHAAELGSRQVVTEELRDLFERQPEVLERENAVEPAKLVGRIVAVARKPVDLDRFEQTQFVVVPQRLDRDLRVLRNHQS